MSKYCKFCGKQIDEDSIYCTHCGSRQSSLAVTNSISPIASTTNDHLISPPTYEPQPQQQKTDVVDSRLDRDYTKETEATVFGIVFAILWPGILKLIDLTREEGLRTALIIFAIIVRIILTIWGVTIASRQNRNTFGWFFLAFFFPAIALIILGQLRKLRQSTD